MPVEIVEDEHGYRVAVGTRVIIYGTTGTVMSHEDPRYLCKYPEMEKSLSRYIPVIHDDGYINGYRETHIKILPPTQIVARHWLCL